MHDSASCQLGYSLPGGIFPTPGDRQWSLDAWRKRSDMNGKKLAIPEKDSKAQPILALLGGDFMLMKYVQDYLHFHFATASCFDSKEVTIRKNGN